MSQWAFVAGAYSIAIGLTTALVVWAHVSMRRAEAAAAAPTRK